MQYKDRLMIWVFRPEGRPGPFFVMNAELMGEVP